MNIFFGIDTKKRYVLKKFNFQILIAAIFLLFTNFAHAHKVNMFAYVEGNDVFVEGYFLDGKKPKNCEVTVSDADGSVLLTGLTNDEGQFTFAIPSSGAIKIKIDAGEGHIAQYLLSAEEVSMADDLVSVADSVVQSDTQIPGPASEQPDNVGLNSNDINMLMVQKAVGRSLHPVMRALDELKERRTMSDIIGGVGIIMGIGGMFLYFKARKIADKR